MPFSPPSPDTLVEEPAFKPPPPESLTEEPPRSLLSTMGDPSESLYSIQGEAAKAGTTTDLPDTPLVSPEMVGKLIRTSPQAILLDKTKFGKGLIDRTAENISGMTTLKNAALIPAFSIPYVGEALAAGIGAQSAGSGAGEAVEALRQKNPELGGQSAADLLLGASMLLPAGVKSAKALRPKDVPIRVQTPEEAAATRSTIAGMEPQPVQPPLKGGESDASGITSTAGVPEHEVRAPVGEETSLRQQGQAAATRQPEEGTPSVPPEEITSPVEETAPPPGATPIGATQASVAPTTPVIDASIRIREVPKPALWGGKPGEKLYIPIDESGKDISVGNQTILASSPEEARALVKENFPEGVKPTSIPQPAPEPAAPVVTPFNKRTGKTAFNELVGSLSRDDLDTLSFYFGDATGDEVILNKSGDGLRYENLETSRAIGKGEKGSTTSSVHSDFVNWLLSDEPLKVRTDPEEVDLINKAREILAPKKSKPPAPVVEAKPAEAQGKQAGEGKQAVQKIATEIKQVAATEGQRSAKEIKSELVQRLEKAIADLPESGEGEGTLKIDIPGDGEFTINNTAKALREVLAKAKRIDTRSEVPVRKIQATSKLRPEDAQVIAAYGSPEEAYRRVAAQNALSEPEARAESLLYNIYQETKAGKLESQSEVAASTARERRSEQKEAQTEIDRIKSLKRQTVAHKESLDYLTKKVESAKERAEFFERSSAELKRQSDQAKQELEQPPPPRPNPLEEQPPPAGEAGLKSMGGALASEELSQPGSYVSNMFAAIDRDRAAMGKPPMPETKRRTWDEDNQKALALMNKDPEWATKLISEVAANPRPLLSWENAGLVWHRAKLKAEYDNALQRIALAYDDGRTEDLQSAKSDAALFEDRLMALDKAVGRNGTGSEAGRTLNAQKMGAGDDFSLVEMRLQMRRANNGAPLTDRQNSDLAQIAKEHAEKMAAFQKILEGKDQRIAELEASKAIDEIKAESKPAYAPEIMAHAKRMVDLLKVDRNAAMSRLKAKFGDKFTGMGGAVPGEFRGPGGEKLTPQDINDLSIIGASERAEFPTRSGWNARMSTALGKWVEPYLDSLWDSSGKHLDNEIARLEKRLGKTKAYKVGAAVKKTGAADKIEDATAKIRAKVESKKTPEITMAVQKLARGFVEQGITEREALIDAVHGVLSDIIPDWTRRETMDAISGYGDFKQLTKDQISVTLRDLKGQMQQVGKLEDMKSGIAPSKTGIERRSPSDAERALIKLVNEAKKKGNYEVTDPATQLASPITTRLTQLRNRLVDLQEEIRTGQRLIKERRVSPTSPEIEALKAEVEKVKAEHAQVFKTALDSLKKSIARRTAELDRRIAEGDFSKRPRREGPVMDEEAMNAKAALLRVEQRFYDARRNAELKNRTRLRKTLDLMSYLRREFVLSSPTSIAKLTAAAAEGITFETLAKEPVGAMVGKMFPRFSDRLEVERPSSIGIEAKSLKDAFLKSMDDAAQTLRTGKSDIEITHGGRAPVPEEMVSYFGRMHAALKTPLKRAAFSRVYAKLTELYIRDGKDPANLLTQMEIGTRAMAEANRMLFLEDNALVNAVRRGISALEQPLKSTGEPSPAGIVGATVARVALPIVRIPTNLVARTVQAAVGFPVGATKLAIAYARGIETLKPHQADLIARQIKQGSIGGAFLLAGFLAPQIFGGYYQPRQKQKPGEPKFGTVKIGDYNIPSFLLHHPLLEVMQLGATIRKVADSLISARQSQAKGLAAGVIAGARGMAEEVPIGREMLALGRGSENTQEYLDNWIAGVIEPQVIQWLARQMDKPKPFSPTDDTIKRKPKGLTQHLEMGIPGLRENVPKSQH